MHLDAHGRPHLWPSLSHHGVDPPSPLGLCGWPLPLAARGRCAGVGQASPMELLVAGGCPFLPTSWSLSVECTRVPRGGCSQGVGGPGPGSCSALASGGGCWWQPASAGWADAAQASWDPARGGEWTLWLVADAGGRPGPGAVGGDSGWLIGGFPWSFQDLLAQVSLLTWLPVVGMVSGALSQHPMGQLFAHGVKDPQPFRTQVLTFDFGKNVSHSPAHVQVIIKPRRR